MSALELTNLKCEDIKSEEDPMFIVIRSEKSTKARKIPLTQTHLDILRTWWKIGYPKKEHHSLKMKQSYLFCDSQGNKLSEESLKKIWTLALNQAYPQKSLHINILKKCFATHAFENGINLFLISQWLGHSSLYTTTQYIAPVPLQEKENIAKLNNISSQNFKNPHAFFKEKDVLKEMQI